MRKCNQIFRLTLCILAIAWVSPASAADFDINIFVTGTQQTSIPPLGVGHDVHLSVEFTTDIQLSSASYRLEFDFPKWALVSRDYATFGWESEDGFIDDSSPKPSSLGTPLTIGADIDQLDRFSPQQPTAAFDIVFESARPFENEEQTTVTGTFFVEDLVIRVPAGIPEGGYQIGFAGVDASDENFMTLAQLGITPTSGTFTVNVIPEPSTWLLFTVVLCGLATFRCRFRDRNLDDRSALQSLS